MTRPKIIVVELDGATWHVIKPLLDRGDCPNLRRLMEQGSSGILRAEMPLVSPLIWTSIWTGKNPEKHGIFGFLNLQADILVSRLWDILQESVGYSIGLAGALLTWPPRPYGGGFCFGDPMARSDETFPAGYEFLHWMRSSHGSAGVLVSRLATSLRQAWSGGVAIRNLVRFAATAFQRVSPFNDPLDWRYRLLNLHAACLADCFLKMLRETRVSYAGLHIHSIDTAQHWYWRFLEPKSFSTTSEEVRRYGNVIADTYREADRILGQVLRSVSLEDILVVLSDHGGRGISRDGIPGSPYFPKTKAIFKALGLPYASFLYSYFADFVNLEPLSHEAVLRIGETAEKLASLRCEAGGRPLFKVLVNTAGKRPSLTAFINREPEIGDGNILLPSGERLAAKELLAELSRDGRYSGDHHPDGIYILRGPDIAGGCRGPVASPVDITPTLLHLLDLPVGEDMDGRVLHEIMAGPAASRLVRFVPSYGETRLGPATNAAIPEAVVEENLRALGYLD